MGNKKNLKKDKSKLKTISIKLYKNGKLKVSALKNKHKEILFVSQCSNFDTIGFGHVYELLHVQTLFVQCSPAIHHCQGICETITCVGSRPIENIVLSGMGGSPNLGRRPAQILARRSPVVHGLKRRQSVGRSY